MSTVDLPIAKPKKAPAAPAKQIDWAPIALVPLMALVALPLVGSFPTWVTLTVAGLAMGMIFFTIASGLTLIFGLMDVLNFGHGLFIALGAYVALSVFGSELFLPWLLAESFGQNVAVFAIAIVAAMIVCAIVGWVFERVLVRRVYGLHLMQILITMGGMVVGEELIKVLWGADVKPIILPATFIGSMDIGDVSIEKYRLIAVVVGLLVFATMLLVLNRTKLGLLIRAGVQDTEMVESLGYRIKALFVGVFVTGTALAGLGGVMWGLYQQSLTAQMGASVNVLIFIVIIIGGLGSTAGSFIGALLLALLTNYTGYLTPKIALVSNILLMVAILAWRPNGLYKVTNR